MMFLMDVQLMIIRCANVQQPAIYYIARVFSPSRTNLKCYSPKSFVNRTSHTIDDFGTEFNRFFFDFQRLRLYFTRVFFLKFENYHQILAFGKMNAFLFILLTERNCDLPAAFIHKMFTHNEKYMYMFNDCFQCNPVQVGIKTDGLNERKCSQISE